MTQVQERIFNWFADGQLHWIVTANPEIIVYSTHSQTYRQTLAAADLRLPDGQGLVWATGAPERITGVELAEQLLRYANQSQQRVLCIVRQDGRSTLQEVQRAISARAPQATIVVESVDMAHWQDSISQIDWSTINPHLILVGLGFPTQEYWLQQAQTATLYSGIGMGVGGTFDFWTGIAQRAPDRWQRWGVEWLWRLLHQPQRLGRILTAVVVFPWLVIKERIKQK